MQYFSHIFLVTLCTSIIGCQSHKVINENPPSLSWAKSFNSEVEKNRRENEICQTIPKQWILEIVEPEKTRAAARLSNKNWVDLSLADFKIFADITAEVNSTTTKSSLAGDLLWDAIKKARKEPESRAFNYCQYLTGTQCSEYLSQLSLQGLSRGRTPYLIRSVRKNPNTGRYEAKECESGVVITHSSLSRTSSEPENNPIIVFLKRSPRDIFSYTSVAQ